MISVGNNSDARKGLGLGLGFGGGGGGVGMREMEEPELEEGEACSYQNNHDDYDASIDPDIALSYIDEKIQDVLGHFQKDFEGGVSAENLGAKFGGYGSFLPTYQRSPGWGRPRTPPKAHSQNTPESPNILQLEGGRGNATRFSAGPQSLRLGPGSVSSSRLPAVKSPLVDDAATHDKCMMTTGTEAFTSKYESSTKKPTSISDQKTLKVRIKMGPDNLPIQKNAAIYSGLGLDVSPSSSPDDSHSESEGLSREPQDAPFESPASILQIMTAFPTLLSPLTDDLIQLNEKKTCPIEAIPVPVHKDDSKSSGMLQRGSNIVKGDKKLSGGKKIKSLWGHESSIEVKASAKKNTQNDVEVPSIKGQGLDELTAEELVSKTLKLPLLSSSYSVTDISVKNVDGTCDTLKEANKTMVREKTYSDHSQKEWVQPTSKEENGFVRRSKGASGDSAQKGRVEPTSTEVNGRIKGGIGKKVVGDKVPRDLSVYAARENSERDKICDSVVAEPDISKARTASNTEHIEPRKKSKGSHGTMAIEREKEKLKVGTSLVSKTKKGSADNSTSKNGSEEVRRETYSGKARDTYIDFFGELEEEEDRIDSPETPCGDKLKETKVVKRSMPAINRGAKESSGGKIADKPLTSDVYPKTATNVKYTGNVDAADADNGKGGVSVSVPSFVMEDNWVQCDHCLKWRLLPAGTNPDNLPEKWLCSMLDWLPEMNRCSFSEDETTKALIALYQGPPPEGQSNLQNVSASVMVGEIVARSQHPDQRQLNHEPYAVPVGKKKIGKEISNSANKDGSSQISSSMKKNLNCSMKSRSLNDVDKSPVMNDDNALGEKHKNKQRMLGQVPARGDTKNPKVKSKNKTDQDCSRPYKKGRIDGMHATDDEWMLEQGGTTRKGGHSLNSSFPTTSFGKNQHRQKDRCSSRDSKYDRKDRLQVSVEITKDKGHGSLDEGSLDLGNCASNHSVKKRKLKEYQDTQLREGRHSVQEFGDSRKEKKARISKSEGRESGSSKGSGRTDKKGRHTKNQKLRQYPGSTLPQQCLGSVQTSAAATTSSSSKVSGSHKTKAIFQEVKGSPVESVSSSPPRLLNADKSTNRELMWKDDPHDIIVAVSPRQCSDGDGSDRSRKFTKDISLTTSRFKSHESSILDCQNKGANHVLNTKSKGQTLPSPDIVTGPFINGGVHIIGQDGAYPATGKINGQCDGEDRNGVYHANGHPRKSSKGSHLKDNSDSSKSESNAEKAINTGSPIQLQECPSESKQHVDGKPKLQRFGFKLERSENIGNKDYTGNDKGRKEDQLNRKHDVQEVDIDAMCKQEELPANQNRLPDCDTERASKRFPSGRTDQELDGQGKLSLPLLGGDQVETSGRLPQPFGGLHKGNGDVLVDPPKVNDVSKLQKKQIREADHQNETQQIGFNHPTRNGHRSKELEAPSPIRRDSNSQAANNALKEAKDLKHLADRLKNTGSTHESTGIYFQATLKFLQGASLLESSSNENTKHSEMAQSKQIYSTTAKMCEFCAHEYEKSNDMAAAALAYKCMEVAYMRVIYSSNASASRDRHELQTALQMVPLGESPSSSASDVDNVNNSTSADKVALSKSISSPQVAGTHLIAARNRPNIVRLLSYAQDVNFALEASRKSRHAFAAVSSSRGEGKCAEGISSIRQALDFSFQDVEGLLRLVRVAMESIT